MRLGGSMPATERAGSDLDGFPWWARSGRPRDSAARTDHINRIVHLVRNLDMRRTPTMMDGFRDVRLAPQNIPDGAARRQGGTGGQTAGFAHGSVCGLLLFTGGQDYRFSFGL
jgi:hypothetical protein